MKVYEVKPEPDDALCQLCGHQVVHHGFNGCFHTRVMTEGPIKAAMICSCEASWGIEAAMDRPAAPPAIEFNTQPLANIGIALVLAWSCDPTFARGALLELD